ncbi:YicC/YloC family endoribonuclease [Methylocapsa polymorpha]|uniref:YicC/YloC family endoribonuclease n=1 Tax=Methylocapsa polymorpha TaxID=3080828 RepID=A0ABZ0HR21_9HYPH|nr:YicC/YloC family endoribonuclease [Methylocapsa sp. RX1]
MMIASMTGFAGAAGNAGSYRWAWELKSVNAKGLDVRLRLAQGFDAIEPDARLRITRKLARGTIYASLTAQRELATPEVRVNRELLGKLIAAVADIELQGAVAPATLDGLLAVRGVVEIADAAEAEAEIFQARAAALGGLDAALEALVAMRLREGGALASVLTARLERIAKLTQAAEVCPARKPEAVRARLEQSLAALAGHANFDQNRLHQEALMLAAKADIREELDRLVAHAAAARDLLAAGGAVGRRLDFLAQELAREANTLCAKSNDASLTALGLELRVEIEQFREQIQNIE